MITNVVTQRMGEKNPRSITQIVQCEAPDCKNVAEFEASSQESQVLAGAKNPWLRTYRTVSTGDGRAIGYCGDICEANGIKSGAHNQPEQKQVQSATSAADIMAAAAAAEAAKRTDETLRNGSGGQITLTD